MSRRLFLFVSVFLLAGLLTASGSPEIEPIEPSKEVAEVVALQPVVAGGEKQDDDVVVGQSPPETKLEKVSIYFGASGSFVHGFIATLSVILVSELGDKTFFIGEFALRSLKCLSSKAEIFQNYKIKLTKLKYGIILH